MRIACFLAVIFLFLAMGESSLIWVAQPSFIATFPLLVTAGFLVFQRIGIMEGIMWFCVIAIVRGDITALMIMGIAPLFMVRIFTTRSVYALLGLGMTTFAGMLVTTFIVHVIAFAFHAPTEWHLPFSLLITQWILLIPGLYIGFLFVRWFERVIGSRVSLKSRL